MLFRSIFFQEVEEMVEEADVNNDGQVFSFCSTIGMVILQYNRNVYYYGYIQSTDE